MIMIANYTQEDRWLNIAEASLVVLLWIITVALYLKSPDTIPVHFDLSGTADRWEPKWFLFVIPALLTIVTAVVVIYALKNPTGAVNIPGVDVKKKQSPMAAVYCKRLAHFIAIVLLLMTIAIVYCIAMQQGKNIMPAVFFPIVIIFIGCIYYTVKIARLR